MANGAENGEKLTKWNRCDSVNCAHLNYLLISKFNYLLLFFGLASPSLQLLSASLKTSTVPRFVTLEQ